VVLLASIVCSTPKTEAAPKLNDTWRMSVHNAYWHGPWYVIDGQNFADGDFLATGPKQHILDDLYIDRMRGLEFDVHRDWSVYHTAPVGHSLCKTLADCLNVLRAYHYANPQHDVTFVHVEIKGTPKFLIVPPALFAASCLNICWDGCCIPPADRVFDLDGGSPTPQQFDQLLATYLGDGGTDWVYGPREFYATHCSATDDNLAAALSSGTCDWPTTDELRGKFIVTVHGAFYENWEDVDRYSAGGRLRSARAWPMQSVFGPPGSCGPPGNVVDPCACGGNGACNNARGEAGFTDFVGFTNYVPAASFANDMIRGGQNGGDAESSSDIRDSILTLKCGALLPEDCRTGGLPGFNIIPTDAPRNMPWDWRAQNMLLTEEWTGGFSPPPFTPQDWSAGCRFKDPFILEDPNGGYVEHYVDGCVPPLREANSGIFVSALSRTWGHEMMLDYDSLVFVAMPLPEEGQGSLRAFVSTRTEALRGEDNGAPDYGPAFPGELGCIMARKNLTDARAPYVAICRLRHRDSWSTDGNGSDPGVYWYYRTQAGQEPARVYQPDNEDGVGYAEVQNFLRLYHFTNAQGQQCWRGFMRATNDPSPRAGSQSTNVNWTQRPLDEEHGDICFDPADKLQYIGYATTGGYEDPWSPDCPPSECLNSRRGEYLFADAKYCAGDPASQNCQFVTERPGAGGGYSVAKVVIGDMRCWGRDSLGNRCKVDSDCVDAQNRPEGYCGGVVIDRSYLPKPPEIVEPPGIQIVDGPLLRYAPDCEWAPEGRADGQLVTVTALRTDRDIKGISWKFCCPYTMCAPTFTLDETKSRGFLLHDQTGHGTICALKAFVTDVDGNKSKEVDRYYNVFNDPPTAGKGCFLAHHRALLSTLAYEPSYVPIYDPIHKALSSEAQKTSRGWLLVSANRLSAASLEFRRAAASVAKIERIVIRAAARGKISASAVEPLNGLVQMVNQDLLQVSAAVVTPIVPTSTTSPPTSTTTSTSTTTTMLPATSELLVFVTRRSYSGAEIGGLGGADTICAGEAQDESLPGTYKAWLSDSRSSVASRMSHGSMPYVMVDGTKVADDWNDLTDGSLDAPITLTSGGENVGLGGVWTATTPSGDTSYPANTCVDWTSDSGMGADGYHGASNGDWTLNSVQPLDSCSVRSPLYCFQEVNTTCGDSYPSCNGNCGGGQTCVSQTIDEPFGCVCVTPPLPCGGTYPSCDGTCPAGQTCVADTIDIPGICRCLSTSTTTVVGPPACDLNCMPSNCVCPPGQHCSPEFGCN
jgi:hypothetical protein